MPPASAYLHWIDVNGHSPAGGALEGKPCEAEFDLQLIECVVDHRRSVGKPPEPVHILASARSLRSLRFQAEASHFYLRKPAAQGRLESRHRVNHSVLQ